MGNKPELETSVVDILSVSPFEEDHDSLRRMFECPAWAIYTDCRWRLHQSATIESAFATVERSRIPVLICERTLPPGTWVDMLEQLDLLPEAPSMIVSSRSTDAPLWAEVLNRGAFDLLAKPFDATEVVRVVNSAWLHWQDRHSRLAMPAADKVA
jgi:DNA-binding NtrC family response regulator